MDHNTIIEKYKNLVNKEPTMHLVDGGTVIGQEIDVENHLFYVVNRNGVLTIEPAEGAKVASVVIKSESKNVIIDNGKVISVK